VGYARLNTIVGQMATQKINASVIVASVVARLASLENTSQSYNLVIPTRKSGFTFQGKHVTFMNMHNALNPSDLGNLDHPNATRYEKMANTWYPTITANAPVPVPEPGTLWALITGYAVYLTRRRGKRKQGETTRPSGDCC
jgi:hypothetical protein